MSLPSQTLLCLALLGATACNKSKGEEAPTGWAGVDVELSPFSLRFGNAEIPAGGLSLGIEDAYDPTWNHDPWNQVDPELEFAIPDFDWATAETATWEGEDLLLQLSDGHSARLVRSDDDEGLGLHLGLDGADEHEPAAGTTAASYVRISVSTADGEALYGLGEVFAAVNQRGRVQALQMEADFDLESSYNEVHVPVPFLVGASGWGLGLRTDWPAIVDAAASDAGAVTAVVNAPLGLDLVLFSDEDASAIPAAWARATALPRRPPDWALAPMLWRNENESGDEVLADAAAIREHDLAFGVMWIDNPWQTTYNSMVPDPARLPDWTGMVESLHAAGFRWLAWTTPYVEDTDPDHDAFVAADLTVDLPIAFNGFGDLMDLTNDDAQGAWQARVSAARDIGIEGWKLDYGEDIQVGLGKGRLQTVFSDGSDERTMHHRFAEHYHRAYSEPYGDADRFLLGRAGAWGSAAITDCIWPGDLDSAFETFGEDGHVGGLPAAIHGGVSLSVSGFPCFASDTGGYRHDRTAAEVMIRWTEYSALLPVMQVGGSGNEHNYWNLEGDWTEAVLEAGQRYTQLHTRLFPFFQALLAAASRDGTPALLPAGLLGADPDAAFADETFVVGRTLLVAAVIEAGASSRAVSLPPGTWVDWWTGEAVSGDVVLDAPLGQGPLLVASGGIVPLLRPEIRTLAPSADGVESWADDPGPLTIRAVPGDGSFTVEDGPVLALSADTLSIGDLGIYSGISVEIWAPEARTLLLDGAELETTQSGPWLLAEAAEGEVSWK